MAEQVESIAETERDYRSSTFSATSHRLIGSHNLASMDRNDSMDSAFDDVFTTTNIPSCVLGNRGVSKSDACHHGRCDSGVDSQGKISCSTCSDSRLSIQSWHGTSLHATNGGTEENTKSAKLARKCRNFGRMGSIFGKNMPFTSSLETSSTYNEILLQNKAILHSTLTRSCNQRQEVSCTPLRSHDQENTTQSSTSPSEDDSFVDQSTMLEALKQLQEKAGSGKAFAQVGRQITFGTCAVGVFNNKGGRLTLPTLNVSLYIPENALETNEPQLVYIYVMFSSSNEPSLEEGETWLTPTVECGPSGLTFSKDVFLSIPHAATALSEWKVTAHRGEDNPLEWRELKDGKDTIIFVGERKVTLAIDHFSPYKLSGRSSDGNNALTKWMKTAVFLDNYETTGDEAWASFHIRLCNFQDWKRLLCEEGVREEDEKTISAVSIPVADNGEDVTVSLQAINPAWHVTNIKEKRINFDDVWSGYQHALESGELSVPIQMKTTNAMSMDPLNGQGEFELCRIEVSQMKDMVGELAAKMTSEYRNKHQGESVVRKTPEEICQEMEDRFLAQQSDLNPSHRSLHYLSDSRYRRICSALDGANNIQSGWNSFAAFIGINDILIRDSIETRARCQLRSPSAIVLDFFFSDSHDMDILDTLRMLSNIFLDVNNNLAKATVDEEINERYAHVSGSHDAFTTEDQSDSGACAATILDDQNNNHPETSKTNTVGKAKHKRSKWLSSFKGFISKTFRLEGADIPAKNDKVAVASVNSSSEASYQKGLSDTSVVSSTSISEADVITSSDANSQLLKPIQRQTTGDSGVFSQRGSSINSSSSFLQ